MEKPSEKYGKLRGKSKPCQKDEEKLKDKNFPHFSHNKKIFYLRSLPVERKSEKMNFHYFPKEYFPKEKAM